MMPFPYLDPSLSLESRTDDLVGRLTIEEKCQQLHWAAPAIERIELPAYNWWNEALHGVARAGRATVFPQVIGMAATWDREAIEDAAAAIALEGRAKHHAAQRRGSMAQYQGLTFWAPNVNIFRDPRWGRGQETWGEDPFLTGELGAAFVRGLQGNNPEALTTAACAKHFAVHSGPEGERHHFNAKPPQHDFWETYLPAFQRLVDEGVESVMPAYNRVYDEPCAGSFLLLQDILREKWQFAGHVVSDCWALRNFYRDHKVTANAEESAALALQAGTDLNCGEVYCDALYDAYRMKLVTEAEIDQALRRLLRTRFRLGLLDPKGTSPLEDMPLEVVNSEAHRKLARDLAAKSFVLLKNNDQTLPLPADLKSLLITGPNATALEPLLGNYYGIADRLTSVAEGVAARLPEGVEVDLRPGVPLDFPRRNQTDWTNFVAAKRDYCIAAIGLSPLQEGEEGDAILSDSIGDRRRIELPAVQIEFIRELREALDRNGEGKKLIVLLFGGGAIACPEVHELADALLQVWYPGEAGGEAIADVLFGDAVPGGRLPITVPVATDVLPAFADYAMAGRTYRFMQPAYIRSDNGPEFIAQCIQKWLAENKIKTIYIDPGCPWQNGFVESFNDKFRRECLNRELIYTLSESRVIFDDYRHLYNHERPHRSLGLLTPAQFAKQQNKGFGFVRPTASLCQNLQNLNNPVNNNPTEVFS